MFMSLREHIKSWLPQSLKMQFQEGSPSSTLRLQYVWAGGLFLILLLGSYGIVGLFFTNDGTRDFETSQKVEPLDIETSTSKVNLEEARYHKLAEENTYIKEDLKALKKVFQESLKEKGEDFSPSLLSLEERIEDLQTQLQNQQRSQTLASSDFEASFSGNGQEFGRNQDRLIHKHTLILSEKPQQRVLKTIETMIPAGAFAKTVLLSGLDASASMTASSDPKPMLLRLIDHGTLPRHFQSDLKDCHCTAGAYGDLSSERVYARLEKMTCIDRTSGEIMELQVSGYIAGPDGKAGIRGIVASQDGKLLSRSLMGGVFAGLSNVANPQNRQSQVNPFNASSSQVSPPSMAEMFTSGMTQGTTTALDRLSQYYIDRAEQLQPVIQVDAGQVVDIVFTEGVSLVNGALAEPLDTARTQITKRKSYD